MSARRFGRRGLGLLRSGLAYQPGEVSQTAGDALRASRTRIGGWIE